MQLTMQVLNCSTEDREMVGKDGTKRQAKIAHVLGMSNDKPPEIYNVRGYDPSWPLPAIGDKAWVSPRVRKYENFDGNVAEVMV